MLDLFRTPNSDGVGATLRLFPRAADASPFDWRPERHTSKCVFISNARLAGGFFHFGGSEAAFSPLTPLATGAIQPLAQILKMKKFSIFAPRPKDNVGLSEAIKVLRRRRAGCVIR
jgi:hypothetical protein